MSNILKLYYTESTIEITNDTTPFEKEELDFDFAVGLKQLKAEGNLVYEYNPFRNFRTELDTYYYNSLGELVSIVNNQYEPVTLKYRQRKLTDAFGKEYYVDKFDLLDASETSDYLQITLTLNNINTFIKKELFGKIYNIYSSDEVSILINEQLNIKGYNYQLIVKTRSGQLVDFNTNLFNFDPKNPVNIECQPSYDGSVNLIINDDKNNPKLINSRFTCLESNTYKIIDREGNNDTNIYDDSEFEVDTSLYKQITKIPKINYLGLTSGGSNKVGNYVFYFKLSDSDGNETDFIGESGIVTCHIGNVDDPFSIRSGKQDEISHKMILLSLTNLDSSYEYVSVYFSRTTGSNTKQELTTYGRIDKKYYIKNNVSKITITGYENIEDKTNEDINMLYNQVDSVKAQAICQNMLFLGNISKPNIPYKELSDLALRFLPKLKQDINIGNLDEEYNSKNSSNTKGEYYNTKNIYYNLGYWDKEIYRLGVKFILPDFSFSPVFNIRGRDELGSDPEYVDFPVYTKNNDGTLVRNYIEVNDDYTIKNPNNSITNYLENSKGVIRINASDPIIKSTGVFPIGVNIKIDEDVVEELKKYTKGFIIVRQKRIPTILTQAITIGLEPNSFLPCLPVNLGSGTNERFILERFIDNNVLLEHDFTKHLYKFGTGQYKAAISPDVELNSELYSQLFTGTKFNVSESKHQPYEKDYLLQSRFNKRSFYCEYTESQESDQVTEDVKITLIPDNTKLKTSGTQKFAARAGDAEEAWRVSYIQVDSNTTKPKNVTRGSWGTYIGIEDYNQLLKIIDIHIPNYDLNSMTEYFQIRYDDIEPYYNISDPIDYTFIEGDIIDNKIQYDLTCYRGDCFVGNFTHRMQRNFQDPETPVNDQIVEPESFRDNFDPKDKDSNVEINRSDVNAVQLGHWITTKFCSNINLSMRDIDDGFHTEMGLTGIPRNFFPLYNKSVGGESKIPESSAINIGINSTTSDKYGFIVPDVPYIKNEFDMRILYSDVHVTDAFKNGFRNFKFNNYQDYPRTYGSIIKLVEWYGSLICIFEHGIALIPVNERTQSANSSGGMVYINTDKVLPINPRILSSDYGTMWADSIVVSKQYVYGVDTVAKKIWRTNGEKFESISDFRVQSFLNNNITLNSRELTPYMGIRNVKSHFNAFKNDIMFTFYDDLYGLEEKVWNLTFNEIQNKWVTFYSWIPSFSENINNIYFSFDRSTSKLITKLGKSNSESTFADGIVIDDILFRNNDVNITIEGVQYKKLGRLFLVNRNLPTFVNEKISYVTQFTVEKDNYSQHNNFKIVTEGEDTFLCYKVKSENSGYDQSTGVITVNLKANITILDYSQNDLEIKQYIDGYKNYITQNSGYFKNSICVVGKDYILDENNLTTSFWKHGQAGIFDTEEKIRPTKWYGKVHPFEFEFVVATFPGIQKIFSDLQIISNQAEPDSLHFELVGDSYQFKNDKQTMYFRQELTKKLFQDLGSDIKYDREFVLSNNKSSEKEIIRNVKSTLLPLYYQRIAKFDDIYDHYQQMTSTGSDYENLSGSEIVYDEKNDSYKIVIHKKIVNIENAGIIRSNAHYKEDTWNIQIPSINFKNKNETWDENDEFGNNNHGANVPIIITDVPNDIDSTIIPDSLTVQNDKTWSTLNEALLRDKYIKIKVRYSGNNLAIITGIRTLFNISYA